MLNSPKFDGRVVTSFSADGFVATILIDRQEKLNALTLSMLEQLSESCREIDDSEARVVIVRSSGDRVFCVGADITHFSTLSPASMWRKWVSTGHRAFDALSSLRQPTIAAIDGLALGGGFELALACDLRVLSVDASLGLPEGGLGTVPGWGGTERVTQLVGRARAKDLALTRRRLTSAEALDWGVATRVAAAGEFDAAVGAVVFDVLGSAPIAAQLAKQIINAAADGAPSAILESIAAGFAAGTADLVEGVVAFREKRPPTFIDA